MEFSEVLKKRRSVRSYEDRLVEPEKIKKILEAVDSAPSAGNLKAFRVTVIEDEETRKALTQAALGQDFITQAPVCFAVIALPEKSASRYGERGRSLYSLQDSAIAATFIQLAAVDLGLASCWVGAFNDEEVGAALGLSEGEVPAALIPVGYAAE